MMTREGKKEEATAKEDNVISEIKHGAVKV
jgi:hypothetical protein